MLKIKTNNYICTLLISALLFSYACNDDEPGPCNNCPIDFALIDYEPAWSPDGQWIAYVHGDSRPGYSGIYLIRPDGTDNHLWYQGYAEAPAWSPDGQWIAFSTGHIWKQHTNGDSLTQLTFEGRNFFPTWGGDSNSIFFDGLNDNHTTLYGIWKINTIDKSLELMSYEPNIGAIRMPNYNFGKLIHVRYFSGFSSEIHIMDTTANNLERLTNDTNTNLYPKLSQSIEKVLFTSQPQDDWPQIWIMDSHGENRTKLAERGYSADWSPYGQKIVYCNSSKDNGRLWLMNADGSNKIQLTFEHQFYKIKTNNYTCTLLISALLFSYASQ